MTTAVDTSLITQVYRVYIKATPQAIWDAITLPEWTERYGYGGAVRSGFIPGQSYEIVASPAMQAMGMPEVIVAGETVEADEPRRLVLLWRANWDNEPATRLTYEIGDCGNGVCSLTVTHELDGAPNLANMVAGRDEPNGAGGGWAQVLSDLKSLLETGESLFGSTVGS
jgi:uncharacterized protein YndB with AHSA1/START domain